MKNLLLTGLLICSISIKLFGLGNPAAADGESKISGEIVWKFQTNNLITSSPAYSDGVIYIGSGSSLLAIDTSGREIFRFKTKGSIKCKAAVDRLSAYFQSGDGWLYSVDKKTGRENWKFQLHADNYLQLYDYWDYYHSSPVLSENVLYVGSSDACLYAIDCRSGSEIWKFKTMHIIRSSPVCQDGKIYFGSFDGRFYSLNAETGSELWNYRIEKPNFSRQGEIQSSALIAKEKVIFGSRDGNLHALDVKTGEQLWNYSHEGSWIISTPALYDTLVITGSSDEHFVNATGINTGKQVWRYSTRQNVFSSPCVSSGVVYCGEGNAYSLSEEASFFALEAATGKELWRIKTGGQVWSSPLVVNGRLYFASMDGFVYSVK
ncbi:MAG: PQQ-binding-like beta-propeller repeat protein [Syntrophothermus sp.]